MCSKFFVVTVALALAMLPAAGLADTIGDVENARAKERQGRWLDRQDREQLNRWGSNDGYGYGRYATRRTEPRPYDYDHGPVYYYRAYPY